MRLGSTAREARLGMRAAVIDSQIRMLITLIRVLTLPNLRDVQREECSHSTRKVTDYIRIIRKKY